MAYIRTALVLKDVKTVVQQLWKIIFLFLICYGFALSPAKAEFQRVNSLFTCVK
jgi:hypothetical protein